jgi:hypothetical protein
MQFGTFKHSPVPTSVFSIPRQHVDVYLFSGRPPLLLVGSNIHIYKRNWTGIPELVENQTGTF